MPLETKDDVPEIPEVPEVPKAPKATNAKKQPTPEEIYTDAPNGGQAREEGEYTVVTPVKRGGKRYAPGEKIRFGNVTDEAKALLAA